MKDFYYLMLATAMCACASGNSDNNAAQSSQPQHIHYEGEMAAHEVPLPAVPDSLTRPSQRADYLMMHFWDGMDFNDSAMTGDTLLVEQTFSNFIELLPHTSSPEALSSAVRRMYQQASVNPAAFALLVDVADKYLNDEDSPFRNPALYRYFKDAEALQQNN